MKMKVIVAMLIYDSWKESVPELRTASSPDRHLIFEGDGVILDLLLRKDEDGMRIHVGGQVLPQDGSLDSVADVQVVVAQGRHRSCTHTNALGEFAIHGVPNGTLDLAITLSNRCFKVQGLSNSEPRKWRIVPVSTFVE
jgi:hypothetical protein